MLRALSVAAALLLLAVLVLPASAMSFQLLQSGKGQRAVLASGEIDPGDAAGLLAALNLATRSRNGTKQLLLDSPGGHVDEAFAMADVMDQVGVSTVVPARAMCASACASVLFVSGKYRTLQPGGALVIHSCFDERDGAVMTDCNALIAEHAQHEGSSGAMMMALQQVAGTHAVLVFTVGGAACFGLTRAPGTSARHVAPCVAAAERQARGR
jgi:hypothetical protein